jgi:hypothetical protein
MKVLKSAGFGNFNMLILLCRWCQQVEALFSPLRFKVLLAVSIVPGHLWSVEVVQSIIGSLCLVFEPAPQLVAGEDLSKFFVIAWSKHPDLIPVEVGCIVPEPAGPSVVGKRPLFLWGEELIHSMLDTLQFHAFMEVLEVHNFSIPSVDINEDSSSDSEMDGHGGYQPGQGSGLHRPWPRVF